jgi:hypothetical protein
MSLKRATAAELVWLAGMAASLVGCLSMLAQVIFAAIPIGHRWPVYALVFGGLLFVFAKTLEWHSRTSARRIVRDALTKARR